MKRIDTRWMAVAMLVAGLGAASSAFAQDPGCYSLCQEVRADCVAQGGSNCGRQYRECIATCDPQIGMAQPSSGRLAVTPLRNADGRCASLRFVDTIVGSGQAAAVRGRKAGI